MVKGALVYRLFRLTIFLTRPLPLWLGYRVAGAVAEICYHFFRRQREALNENLAWVLQTRDRRAVDAVARRAFRNFGKFVIDFVHLPVMTREEVHRRLCFSQWTELDDVMVSKRGMLIVTMHFGLWDLGAAALAVSDYPVNVVADNYGYEPMDRLIHGSRERLGVGVLPSDKAARGLRALKRGGILAFLIDVPGSGESVTVDFLGAPAEVSSIPARIALRTGAWVVPAIVYRGPERDTIIRPVLDTTSVRFERTGDDERDVRVVSELIMRSFEPHVRAHPQQWFIFRRMWPDVSAFERDELPATMAEQHP